MPLDETLRRMAGKGTTPAPPVYISADEARAWWRALVTNACQLVDDAAVLLDNESYGRARSLVVLGMEELAKARWLYEGAAWEWSAPLGIYISECRPAQPIALPAQLAVNRLSHAEKLKAAERYASRLGGFWNPSDFTSSYYFPEDLDTFEAAAAEHNAAKQAGFYVDRVGSVVLSPQDIGPDGIAQLIEHAAQVIEMHLIEDHTRQQGAADLDLIDSSQDLHHWILPLAHPAEFQAMAEALNQADEPE
jgi:AbiV family abortive infection protein